MTVTRDPEVLPVIPHREDVKGYWPIPWQPDPSFFSTIEVDIVTPEGVQTITSAEVEEMLEIDRTHEGFKSRQRFTVLDDQTDPEEPGVVLSWNEWMDWQKRRNPLFESPKQAEEVRESLYPKPVKGPGISKRSPKKAAVKKATAKKTSPNQ